MASAKGRGRRVVLCQEQDRAVTNSVTSDDQQGRILEVLTRLEGKLDALVRQQAELVREQGALVRGQAAVTRGQAAITELRVIQNLPAGLCGCKRARITTAAQLDKLLGPGTAAAVERELLGSAERCYLALRALLWAAARELDRVSKQASAKEAAGQVATEVESLKVDCARVLFDFTKLCVYVCMCVCVYVCVCAYRVCVCVCVRARVCIGVCVDVCVGVCVDV